MIKTFYQDDIINCLAAIITYGLNNEYSYKAIEERIIASTFICDLENNKYDIEIKIEDILEQTYGNLTNKNVDISFRGLFFAESYVRLFFSFNKSFEYLFLYWPLSMFSNKYDIYHEMDFSNLKNDFIKATKETTLLRKIANERNLKLVEISKLTGININTIDKYSRDDNRLYGASYENIYKLSALLNVKDTLFIPSLAVYLDSSIYLFDKSNKDYRNYLGFYFAYYYDNRISERDFNYDSSNNYFWSYDDLKIIVICDQLNNITIENINRNCDENTYLVLIPSPFFGNETDFNSLASVKALDVFVLTQEYIYIVKKNIKKEITDTINRSLIIRAKESSSLYK